MSGQLSTALGTPRGEEKCFTILTDGLSETGPNSALARGRQMELILIP